jgi:hypothetical protein
MLVYRKRAAAAATLVVCGGLLLRAVMLSRRPLWFDEIYTLWICRRTPAGILAALRTDSGPPLFYLLEKPFVAAAGIVGDPVARLLPYLGLALLFAAGAARRAQAGWAYPALLAASPLLFFYSGEARPYALLALLGFLLFWSVVRARPSCRSYLAAFACAVALPWTHYLGFFVVASAALIAFAIRRRRTAGAVVAGAATFALWLPVAAGQPRAALAWSQESAASSTAGFLSAYGGWGRFPPYFLAGALPAAGAGVILGALLLGGVLLQARKDRPVRLALAFALLPLALVAAVSLKSGIYFAGRTEMATLPVGLWAIARASRRSRAVAWLALASAAAGAAVIALSLVRFPSTPPYAAVARFVAARARPGDTVLAADADYLPLRLIAEREGQLAVSALPAELESHPGWFELLPFPDPVRETVRLARMAVGPPGSTLFVAFPPDPRLAPILAPLITARPGRVNRFPSGDVILEIPVGTEGSPSAAPGRERQDGKPGEREQRAGDAAG